MSGDNSPISSCCLQISVQQDGISGVRVCPTDKAISLVLETFKGQVSPWSDLFPFLSSRPREQRPTEKKGATKYFDPFKGFNCRNHFPKH